MVACLHLSHVLVVINGVLTHNSSSDALKFQPNVSFGENLLLGAAWRHYGRLATFQSEASVTNVNIFSGQLSLVEMKRITSTGQCTQGDLLSWSEATWTEVGSVQTKEIADFCKKHMFPHLFNFTNKFSATECLQTCPG